MTNRADIYRQKAHECERAANRVADPQVQASYRQMSHQWNEMAQRQQTTPDEALAELLKPLGIAERTLGKRPGTAGRPMANETVCQFLNGRGSMGAS